MEISVYATEISMLMPRDRHAQGPRPGALSISSRSTNNENHPHTRRRQGYGGQVGGQAPQFLRMGGRGIVRTVCGVYVEPRVRHMWCARRDLNPQPPDP